jgi:hypothetical protein
MRKASGVTGVIGFGGTGRFPVGIDGRRCLAKVDGVGNQAAENSFLKATASNYPRPIISCRRCLQNKVLLPTNLNYTGASPVLQEMSVATAETLRVDWRSPKRAC